MRIPSLFGSTALALAAAAPAPAQEHVTLDKLPGYYEFFMKTGELEKLAEERARDRKMDAGEIEPVAIDADLPEFVLPNALEEQVDLRALARNSHLVLVSFRSWW